MDIEKLIPLVGFALIFIIIAFPAIQAIIGNIKEGRRLRRLRQNTPGPLLGVVFPKDNKDK